MILEKGEPVVIVLKGHKIKHKSEGCTVAIVTGPEDKGYRISSKRRRMHDHSSVPFRYI